MLNVCELAEEGPVVVAFLAEPVERCSDQIDLLDRVRERGWQLPVGHDRYGAVANAYAVPVCPMITFAARGGEVRSTSYGMLGERELRARIRALSPQGGR